jgi:hypothetical protein
LFYISEPWFVGESQSISALYSAILAPHIKGSIPLDSLAMLPLGWPLTTKAMPSAQQLKMQFMAAGVKVVEKTK